MSSRCLSRIHRTSDMPFPRSRGDMEGGTPPARSLARRPATPLPRKRGRGIAGAIALVLTLFTTGASAEDRVLRVCADPNNLPFSNQAEEGFENRIAELVAQELGAKLDYVWWAQRRGFVRNTLRA